MDTCRALLRKKSLNVGFKLQIKKSAWCWTLQALKIKSSSNTEWTSTKRYFFIEISTCLPRRHRIEPAFRKAEFA